MAKKIKRTQKELKAQAARAAKQRNRPSATGALSITLLLIPAARALFDAMSATDKVQFLQRRLIGNYAGIDIEGTTLIGGRGAILRPDEALKTWGPPFLPPIIKRAFGFIAGKAEFGSWFRGMPFRG